MVQNLKKLLKSKIFKFFSFLRHEVPFKAKNNREAVVVCAIHVVKRPSKRSVLVYIYIYTGVYLGARQAPIGAILASAEDPGCLKCNSI